MKLDGLKAINRHHRGWGLVRVITNDPTSSVVTVLDLQTAETYPASRRELVNPHTLSNRIISKLKEVL